MGAVVQPRLTVSLLLQRLLSGLPLPLIVLLAISVHILHRLRCHRLPLSDAGRGLLVRRRVDRSIKQLLLAPLRGHHPRFGG